jgi:hypothetical protein
MNLQRTWAGTAAAAVLAADAVLHLYWATGATWPGRDARAVSMALLAFEAPFTPPLLLPLAAALLVAAAALLAAVGRLRAPRLPVAAIVAAVGLAALVRGALGVVWALGFGTQTWTPFYWLNLLLYTPLCLAVYLAVRVVRRGT